MFWTKRKMMQIKKLVDDTKSNNSSMMFHLNADVFDKIKGKYDWLTLVVDDRPDVGVGAYLEYMAKYSRVVFFRRGRII